MVKHNNLRYNEEVMLALYLETFKEYYTQGKNKYDNSFNTTINEGKMQCLCYIFQNMDLFDHDYGFSLNYYTPYSPGIMALINDINNKEKETNTFYDEYYEERKKHFDNYDTLAKYFTYEQIGRINKIISILGNINKKELGIEYMTTLHYFIKTKYPYIEDLDFYVQKIEKQYDIYKNKKDLFEKAYCCLNILDLIETKKTKIPERIRK